jgi:sigma-E processing peptidase SpoIIGA
MDFLSLYISGAFLHLKQSQKQLLFSALLGGCYAVFSVVFEGIKAIGFIISIAVSLLLCYIAYGKEVARFRFLRLWVVFYFVSFLLGGAISAFYNMLSALFSSYDFAGNSFESNKKAILFLLLATFCSLLILLFKRIFTREVAERSCKVSIEIKGQRRKINALIDSGNLLEDPISAKKVIIVTLKSIRPIISDNLFKELSKGLDGIKNLPFEDSARIRIIPVNGVTSSKIIVGYKADKIEVEIIKRGKPYVFSVDAIIGIITKEADSFREYDAIMPESLLI